MRGNQSPLPGLPRRVFLDTNVVNFILDHGGFIFENDEPSAGYTSQDAADLEALRLIFSTGQRAQWELAVSATTYAEISNTSNPSRRQSLTTWFNEVWLHWRDRFEADGTLSDEHATELARKLESTTLLAALPDAADRELLAHAVAYQCDAFCTRDRRTILKHRALLPPLGLEIMSPADWGSRLAPYARLF